MPTNQVLFAGLLNLLILLPPIVAGSTITSPQCQVDLDFISSTAASNDIFQCFGTDPWFRPGHRAPIADCMCAVALLPADHDTRIFHYFGHLDGASLPVKKSYGKCAISFSIREGNEDISSWIALRVVAGDLLKACARGVMPMGSTGGNTTAGNEGKIVVKVGRHTLGGEAEVVLL